MRKIIRPCTVSTGNRRASVYIEIEYNEGKLSLHGVIGPLPSGNCLGSCGQIDSEFRKPEENKNDKWYPERLKYYREFMNSISYAPGWNYKKFQKLLGIWDRWHLNDLKAGTFVQEEFLREIASGFPGYPVSHYEWASQRLAEAGLNPDPDTGYQYGTAWLTEEVPQEVIDWLFSLPDADKSPAWV